MAGVEKLSAATLYSCAGFAPLFNCVFTFYPASFSLLFFSFSTIKGFFFHGKLNSKKESGLDSLYILYAYLLSKTNAKDG